MGILLTKMQDLEFIWGTKKSSSWKLYTASIVAVGVTGAAAAATYHLQSRRTRPEGGWKYRHASSGGVVLKKVAVQAVDGQDDFTRLALIATEADKQGAAFAFAINGWLQGCTEAYTVLQAGGSVGKLDGVFCRDNTVPPGWICIPNHDIRSEGTRGLQRGNVFLMASHADEKGIAMFDTSGFTYRKRQLAIINRSKPGKESSAVYIKYLGAP